MCIKNRSMRKKCISNYKDFSIKTYDDLLETLDEL